MKAIRFILSVVLLSLVSSLQGQACTGITLRAKDRSIVIARTVEWGNSILKSDYVIVPKGYHIPYLSAQDGSLVCAQGEGFEVRYGFVGISVIQPQFIIDGMNEAGLAAGLFFFPGYGSYDGEKGGTVIPDMQFVSWALASFASVDELVKALDEVDVVALSAQIGTVHWRVADATGRQIVIEIINGEKHIHENYLGVFTNSPSFDWHLLNLNNYINLCPGTTDSWNINNVLELRSFGTGSAMLGLPGDITPPSRFVRAAFFVSSAPHYPTAEETVMQSFHILNNFDIPIGVEFQEVSESMPMSATQWTTAASITERKFYYRTYVNMNIRCIDLRDIDFRTVEYQAHPLDKVSSQPIEYIKL